MRKTYRLAKQMPYRLEYFGPYMTKEEAIAYQSELALGGFNVLVVNMESI